MANGIKFDIKYHTYLSLRRVQSYIKLLEQINQDADKEHRVQENECTACYYSSSMAGQAFTPYTCYICLASGMWHSTYTPHYCEACSKKHSICRRCGADRELNESRTEL